MVHRKNRIPYRIRPAIDWPCRTCSNAFFGWGSGRHDPEKGWQDKNPSQSLWVKSI